MADHVHKELERMLPELSDLAERGIFTKRGVLICLNRHPAILQAEIKAIVKRRTDLEYAIHRRVCKRADFLAYIEYESNLEKLRRKRKQRMGLEAKLRDETNAAINARSISDFSIVAHIHRLYRRMLSKFKGSVTLWIQYTEWCKSLGANKILGRIYANAIQLHPTKPTFWVLAASWELEVKGDISAARGNQRVDIQLFIDLLLQRGLRILPKDQKMWLEYFKLELIWVHKLKERRRILFKENLDDLVVSLDDADVSMDAAEKEEKETAQIPHNVEDDSNEGEDQQDQSVTVPTLEVEAGLKPTALEKDKSLAMSMSESTESMSSKKLTPLQQALIDVMIPRVIYRNAIKEIPNDLGFRLSFLDICIEFGKGSTKAIDDILASLSADFSTQPEALSKVAEQHCFFVSAEDPQFPVAVAKTVKTYQKLLEEASTPELWRMFIAFLTAKRSACDEPNLMRYFAIQIQRAYEAAYKEECCTADMFVSWINDSTTPNSVAIAQLALGAFPSSSQVWMEHIVRLQSVEERIKAFQMAITRVNRAELLYIWQQYCDYLIEHRVSDDIITDAFENALSAKNLGWTADAEPIKFKFLEWTFTNKDISDFRSLCTRFTKERLQSVAFFEKCIEIEMLQLERELELPASKAAIQATHRTIEKLWESAVQADRSRLATWIGYIRFMFDVVKSPAKAAQLYWMAGKEVEDKDELEAKYQLMK
eukprot:jgi/Hompol1/1300/HPOL_004631-RA